MRAHQVLLCSILISGCCTTPPQNEGAPATVSEVVGKIKDDVRQYQIYDMGTKLEPPLEDGCKGQVRLVIDSIKVSLTTQTDQTTSGEASATLPVGAGTLDPLTFSTSRGLKGTQTLTFTMYPKDSDVKKQGGKPPTVDPIQFPIAAALQRLRDGLLKASVKGPCFSLALPADDPGGTYEFGFTVTKEDKVGGTLKFAIFSLGASRTNQTQAGNTITVTFKAPGSVYLTAM